MRKYIVYLKDRNFRAGVSIMFGILIGMMYITANILFSLAFESVWYLALAVYNTLLLFCRYFALEINGNLEKQREMQMKVDKILLFASIMMCFAIFFSSLTESYKNRSELVLFTLLIYTMLGVFRFFLIPFRLAEEENTTRFFLLNKIRLLSILASVHGINLQFFNILDFSVRHRFIICFCSAFFCSYFALVFTAFDTKKVT